MKGNGGITESHRWWFAGLLFLGITTLLLGFIMGLSGIRIGLWATILFLMIWVATSILREEDKLKWERRITGPHRWWFLGLVFLGFALVTAGAMKGLEGFVSMWWISCGFLAFWAAVEFVKGLRRGRRLKQQRLRGRMRLAEAYASALATTTTSSTTTTLPDSAPRLATTTTLPLSKARVRKRFLLGLGRIAVEIEFTLWCSNRREDWKKGIPKPWR